MRQKRQPLQPPVAGGHNLRHDRQRDFLRGAPSEIKADRPAQAGQLCFGQALGQQALAALLLVLRLPSAPT